MRTRTAGYGRNIFGLASVIFGAFEAVLVATGHGHRGAVVPPPLRDGVIYVSALGQIAGGIAVQWKGAARTGSALLLIGYVLYSLLFLPAVVIAPLVFGSWGNLFEQLTMVAAAIVLNAKTSRVSPDAGRLLFALCVLSFALYQAFNLDYTASLVPKWMPPGQLFWTVLTTVAFALAAIALFLRRMDALAARLLTLMLLLFQVLIWMPAIVVQPGSSSMWAENVLNFAIAASCWVFAEFLR